MWTHDAAYEDRELMFTPNRKPGEEWTSDHQYLYSLLWSSFLDLDAYSASRFRRRFHPYSTEFAVLELLRSVGRRVPVPEIPQERSRLGNGTTPRLSHRFVDLALWTAVPKLFRKSASGQRSRCPRLVRGAFGSLGPRAQRRPPALWESLAQGLL
jgi:hypothetical protein